MPAQCRFGKSSLTCLQRTTFCAALTQQRESKLSGVSNCEGADPIRPGPGPRDPSSNLITLQKCHLQVTSLWGFAFQPPSLERRNTKSITKYYFLWNPTLQEKGISSCSHIFIISCTLCIHIINAGFILSN